LSSFIARSFQVGEVAAGERLHAVLFGLRLRPLGSQEGLIQGGVEVADRAAPGAVVRAFAQVPQGFAQMAVGDRGQ